MAAVEQDFTIWQGEDKELVFTITENAAALDLTGGTLDWTLGKDLLNISAQITDAVNGICKVDIDKTDSAGLRTGVHTHQLVLTDTSGNVSVVSEGEATVKRTY